VIGLMDVQATSVVRGRRAVCLPFFQIARPFNEETVMLRWALIFLIVALIAGAFGFYGTAGVATDIARVLFFVFLVLLVISLVFGWRGGWGAPPPA
jgi:uncharacterized membrane protein YtjA (UPF0391 family)